MELPTVFLDRYERREELATRSSSKIYSAIDTQNDTPCVLKVFTDSTGGDEQWVEAFAQECQVIVSVRDPHLARVLDYGYTGSYLFIVMEFVEGETLREILKSQGGALEVEQALSIAKQIAFGLETLRQAGIVHAHLDSRAVLIDGTNVKLAGYFPPVIDRMRRAVTSAGGFIVDPAYISPEQVSGSGEPDFRSDLYSLGVMLFEMLTGKKPFVADNAFQAAMMRVAQDPPSPSSFNAELNPILDAVVVKALSKQQDSRFQSFTDFIDAAYAGKGGVEELSDATGENTFAGRLGSETVGVGISVDDIRKMLEQRDKSSEQQAQTQAVQATVGSEAPSGGNTLTETNAVPKAATVGPGQAKQSSGFDDGQTMVGAIEVSDLPASLMVVAGPRRGTRYVVEAGQTVIGSSANCTIAIKEKGIPARFALISKKENDYVIAPFASAGIQVNGETIGGDDEHTLVRGDVIEAGPVHLRYVAPGEVFTLQDDVADRSIDRPKSKVGPVLKIITLLVGVLCLGLFFLFQQGISEREAKSKKVASSTAAKKREVIAKLRKEGDALYKEGHLVEPVGANARTRFEQILEIDPDDTYAKRRIEEIKERVQAIREQRRVQERQQAKIDQLLEQAKSFFDKGDYVSPPGTNAKEAYQSVLRLDPENEAALAGMERLNERLGTMLGRVNNLLAKAREYRAKGQIIAPEGANAHETLKQVFSLNPDNAQAKDLLLDLAAESIYRGDVLKRKAKPDAMKKEYLKAQMLGADPEYLAPRMRGVDLMKRSTAGVIIFDGDKQTAKVPKNTPAGYLDSSEIERRVAGFKLNEQIGGGRASERFIELQ